jgi:hypothetical protein
MAEFMAVTASNHPKLKDHAAVEKILDTYFVDSDCHTGVGFDEQTGVPYLFIYGFTWPEAWKIPENELRDAFYPYVEECYEDGANGFIQLLREIALYLEEPLTVQAVGSERCRFPLSACEWHIQPGDGEVETNEFHHSNPESISAANSQDPADDQQL